MGMARWKSQLYGFLLVAGIGRGATSQYTIDLQDRSVMVHAKFFSVREESVTFKVEEWAGTSDFYRDIYRVNAADSRGRRLTVVRVSSNTWQVHNRRRSFELTYFVTSAKDAFVTASASSRFHVTLLKEWALLWGHAFLLTPVKSSLAESPVTIRFRPNEYHQWATTLPRSRIEHLSDLTDQLFVAGGFRAYERNGVKYLFGNLATAVRDRDLMDSSDRILGAQSRYMAAERPKSTLIVFVDGTSTSSGGTVVRNSAVIYPDLSRDLLADNEATLRLIAHELFHLWNGTEVLKTLSAGQNSDALKWFQEGFTEYYSASTLFREKILDATGFADYLNGLIVASLQYSEIQDSSALSANASHTNDVRLPYTRGALIAFLMDLKLRARTGAYTIDDYMRSVLGAARNGEHNNELRRLWDQLAGPDADSFWENSVMSLQPLPFGETFRQASVPFQEIEAPVFDLGFSIEGGTFRPNVPVTNVKPGSNAEKAGIRAGDVLQAYSFYPGDPSKRATFKAARNGERLDIDFVPARSERVIQVLADSLRFLQDSK